MSDWEAGNRAAWRSILQQALRELGAEGHTVESLVAEREAAIAALRHLCDAWGDNDWDESLHLADIIEKHLARHLEEE